MGHHVGWGDRRQRGPCSPCLTLRNLTPINRLARVDTLPPVSAARLHRRLTAWIALLAMLAFALVPTVSRAMAFASGSSNWAEICTPQGMKLVAAVDGDQAPVQAGASLDHCALCGLSTDGAAPLPAVPAALPLPLGSAHVPQLFLLAAHTLFAWRSAQPRAPPVLA